MPPLRDPVRRALRPGSVLAAAAITALVVAGCGGGGAASKDEYAAELNDFCSQFLAATKELQKTGSGIGGNEKPTEAAKQLGGAVGTFSDEIGKSLSGLREIEPPKEYVKFNSGLLEGLGEAQSRLDKVATTAKSGDVNSLGNIGQTLGGLRVPDPPKDLKAKATKCKGSS